MANGILGKSLTTANQYVKLYTVPSNVQYSVVNLYAINTSDVEATVTFTIGLSSDPAPVDVVTYTVKIPAKGGEFERTCLVVSANEIVQVKTDSSAVVASVRGLETFSV